MIRRLPENGVTVMEMLIVMGALGILAAITFTGYQQNRARAAMTGQRTTLVSIIRESQSRSIAADKGRSWGVRCDGDAVELYSYTNLERRIEQSFSLEQSVRCQHESEISYEKLTGRPVAAADFELGMSGVGSWRVSVSPSGVLEETKR